MQKQNTKKCNGFYLPSIWIAWRIWQGDGSMMPRRGAMLRWIRHVQVDYTSPARPTTEVLQEGYYWLLEQSQLHHSLSWCSSEGHWFTPHRVCGRSTALVLAAEGLMGSLTPLIVSSTTRSVGGSLGTRRALQVPMTLLKPTKRGVSIHWTGLLDWPFCH